MKKIKMKSTKMAKKKTKNAKVKKEQISKRKTKDKITPNTKLSILLDKRPDAAELLFEAGLFCIGCPMSANETISQGCMAHGMKKKEIDELIRKINKKGEKK